MFDALRLAVALGPHSADEWSRECERHAQADGHTVTTTSADRLACEIALALQMQVGVLPHVVAIFEGGAEIGVRVLISRVSYAGHDRADALERLIYALVETAVESAVQEHGGKRAFYRGVEVVLDS